jgi:FkbM family methyltransferase
MMTSLKRANDKLHSYWRELNFIVRNCADWRSRVMLFANTVRFHLGNWTKKGARDKDVSFSVCLRIGTQGSRLVELRRFAGDIFILYEVLCDKCYLVPPTMLPRDSVRIILDCGANIGITSLFFAARYPNARIYSIEPDPNNFVLLERNTRQEPRISPICGAIVSQVCERVYLTTDAPAWGNSITQGKTGIGVKAWTIDEICRENGFAHIDLLKVDIEGAERDLFGNGNFLKHVNCVIIELHNDYGIKELERDGARWGFHVVEPTRENELKMISMWPNTSASPFAICDRVNRDAKN